MLTHFGRALGCFAALALGACATSDSAGPSEPRYTIVKNEPGRVAQEGIPIDKQSDIMMMLQQREPTARKCYQDVLNEKNDRGFQGTVAVIIRLAPGGAKPQVRVSKTTLKSPEVEQCLIERIGEFEFPAVDQGGEMQYEYLFRPAY